jgi:hypothetical protein
MSQCKCGQLDIDKNINLIVNDQTYSFIHNQNVFLDSGQVFSSISEKLNNININSIIINLSSQLDHQIKVVLKTQSNKVIAVKYIGTLYEQTSINNIEFKECELLLKEIDERIILQIYSICGSETKDCCDKLPDFTITSFIDNFCIPPLCDFLIQIIVFPTTNGTTTTGTTTTGTTTTGTTTTGTTTTGTTTTGTTTTGTTTTGTTTTGTTTTDTTTTGTTTTDTTTTGTTTTGTTTTGTTTTGTTTTGTTTTGTTTTDTTTTGTTTTDTTTTGTTTTGTTTTGTTTTGTTTTGTTTTGTTTTGTTTTGTTTTGTTTTGTTTTGTTTTGTTTTGTTTTGTTTTGTTTTGTTTTGTTTTGTTTTGTTTTGTTTTATTTTGPGGYSPGDPPTTVFEDGCESISLCAVGSDGYTETCCPCDWTLDICGCVPPNCDCITFDTGVEAVCY